MICCNAVTEELPKYILGQKIKDWLDIGERSMGEIRAGKECEKGIKEHKNGNEGTVLP
jgi:hypothetical protein